MEKYLRLWQSKPFLTFLRSIGAESTYTKKIVEYNYSEFMAWLKDQLKFFNMNGEEPPLNYKSDVNLSQEDYNIYRTEIIKSLDVYIESVAEKSDTSWKFPYKEIFNGNFPTLDKSKLTPEMKKGFNVDGLIEECYDIYYDKTSNKAITIYYDYSTVNSQWVGFSFYLEKLSKYLKIKFNHKTPLILFDRDLMGINVDNENLDVNLQLKAAMEAERNPIFTLRECARTTDEISGERACSELTIGTWIFLWLYSQRFNIYREQPRQTGKTYDIVRLLGLDWAIGLKNSKILVVHYIQPEAGKNRKAMITAANNLPKCLRFHQVRTKKVKGVPTKYIDENFSPSDIARNITNEERNNILKIYAVGTSASQAERTGRGDTLEFVQIDEINFIEHTAEMLSGVMFAHGTARVLAERANRRYGIYFTSTPGTLSTQSGRRMYDLVFNKMCQFDISLIGYTYEDLRTYMEKNSEAHFFNMSFNYQQLGFNEKWLEDKITETNTTREKFITDMLMGWLDVSTNALFSQKAMGRISNLISNTPCNSYIYEKFHMFHYFSDLEFEDFIKTKNAISIGIDIAYGGEGDNSVMFAVDMETLHPVFVYHRNTIDTTDYSFLIVKFYQHLKALNPNLLIIINPEVDGPGESVLPNLLKVKDIKDHIFRTEVLLDKAASDVRIRGTNKKISGNYEITYGVRQRSNKNRQYLMGDLLFQIVDRYPYICAYKNLFIELGTLQQKNSGKIEHKAGAHDDIVMAMLLAVSPMLRDQWRPFLEKIWNFVVDFRKIKVVSLTSVIDVRKDDVNYGTEGEVTYNIVEIRDPMLGVYDKLVVNKVVNGVKKLLNEEEIQYEVEFGALRNKEDIINMRLPDMNKVLKTGMLLNNNVRVANIDNKFNRYKVNTTDKNRAHSYQPYKKRFGNY